MTIKTYLEESLLPLNLTSPTNLAIFLYWSAAQLKTNTFTWQDFSFSYAEYCSEIDRLIFNFQNQREVSKLFSIQNSP